MGLFFFFFYHLYTRQLTNLRAPTDSVKSVPPPLSFVLSHIIELTLVDVLQWSFSVLGHYIEGCVFVESAKPLSPELRLKECFTI